MANETKHTPGPWMIERTSDFNAAYRVMDEQGVTVALCYQQPHDTWKAKDNARLIAAAPEVLEVCKAVISAYGKHKGDSVWDALNATLQAALAKAEGRQ